jgi:RimJ/RimL family protein N-acetyltransferase
MDALIFTDAAAFAERVGPVIDRYPAFASVLASNLDQTIHLPDDATNWFLLRDGEQAVGAAMFTATYGLFVTPVPESEAGAGMSALAEVLHGAGLTLPTVTAPLGLTRPFIEAWEQQTKIRGRLAASTRVYEIGSSPLPPTSNGAARLASEADLDLASAWTQEFRGEAEPGMPPVEAERVVRRRLARGRLLFWENDDGPVSMAGVSRPISGVARIGSVFTPKAHRRKGFGTAVTVAATRQGFDDGAERCVLYADLANPTSNGIYLGIGYQAIGDSATVTFDRGTDQGV